MTTMTTKSFLEVAAQLETWKRNNPGYEIAVDSAQAHGESIVVLFTTTYKDDTRTQSRVGIFKVGSPLGSMADYRA